MLTIHNTEAIRRIEAAIGYTFRDKRLLVQVLTRKTYLKIDPEAPDNEVLEFYGDTLMNYHVTNHFMSKYAHMLEDGLFFMRTVEQFTELRSHYVCNRYLTERVKALGLARYLRAQNRDAELRRDSEKAYADIFESLVGAIYLDSYQDDALIRAFILRQLGIEPKRAPADVEAFDFDSLRDLPEDTPYDEPDDPLLSSEDTVEEATVVTAVAEPDEERPAEILPEAASRPDTVPVADEIPAPTEEPPAVPTTCRDRLSRLCLELGFEEPTYGETPPNAPNARPVAACTLKYKDVRGRQVKISLNDSGKNLEEATEKAAAKMLGKVEKIALEFRKAAKAEQAEKPAKSKTTRRATTVDTPAVEAQVPAEATPLAEETPAVAIPVDIAPAESIPADMPAEVAVVEEIPAEAISVEPAVETTAEAKPAQKSSAAKKTSTKKKTVPAEEQPAAVVVEEAKPEDKPVEKVPAKKASAKKKATPKRESVPTEQPAVVTVEEAKPEDKPVEKVPAKKASTKKKATPKRESAPAEEQPAVVVVEEAKPEDKPVEEAPGKKASTKKSTAKKASAKKETASSKTDAE